MNLIAKKAFGNPDADIYDYVIAIATLSNRVHTEIQFSDGICFSASPKNGVRFRPEIDTSDSRKWETIPIEADERSVREQCHKFTGLEYDMKGAVLSAFRPCGISLKFQFVKYSIIFFRVTEGKEKMFCSEACTEVLRPHIKTLGVGCKYSPKRLLRAIKG
ncbi:MAG: hypothetical protein ABXS91_10565 [Sulfurimonas sp.]